MKRFLVAILFLVSQVIPVHATVCVRSRVVVQKQAVVAVPTVAVPYTVPVYTASYYDPSAAALAEIAKEIAALRQVIAEMSPAAAKQPAPENEVDAKAANILKTNCAKCHTAGGEQGGVAFFDVNGGLLPDVPRGRVYYQSHKGLMPKGGKPLSDQDVEVLLEWLGKNGK